MENKKLEEKIGLINNMKNFVIKGLTTGLIIGTMYACGDEESEESGDPCGGCEENYHCEKYAYLDTCYGGREGERQYECAKVGYRCIEDFGSN